MSPFYRVSVQVFCIFYFFLLRNSLSIVKCSDLKITSVLEFENLSAPRFYEYQGIDHFQDSRVRIYSCVSSQLTLNTILPPPNIQKSYFYHYSLVLPILLLLTCIFLCVKLLQLSIIVCEIYPCCCMHQ